MEKEIHEEIETNARKAQSTGSIEENFITNEEPEMAAESCENLLLNVPNSGQNKAETVVLFARQTGKGVYAVRRANKCTIACQTEDLSSSEMDGLVNMSWPEDDVSKVDLKQIEGEAMAENTCSENNQANDEENVLLPNENVVAHCQEDAENDCQEARPTEEESIIDDAETSKDIAETTQASVMTEAVVENDDEIGGDKLCNLTNANESDLEASLAVRKKIKRLDSCSMS